MLRESWRLVAVTSAAKIYWVFATLLTAVITARYLGPAGRGILVATVSWVTMFSTFGHLSLSQVVIFHAAGRPVEDWLPGTLSGLISILAPITVLGTAIVTALYVYGDGRIFNHIPPIALFIGFLALPLMLWIEDGNGVLMALGNLHVLNTGQVVGGTIALVLTFFAVGPLHLGVTGAVSAWVIAQAAVVAITFGYVARRAGTITFRRDAAIPLLHGSAKLHLNAVGTYLFTQANILILNHYRSANETAWFQLGIQILTGIQIIPLAVSVVAYSLVSKHGPNGAWPQQKKMLMQVLALVGGLAVVAYIVSPWVVPLIFGRPFAPAVPVVRILLLSVFGMTLSIVMASQWISRGLFIQAAGLTMIVGALTVLGNYIFVPRFGMYGAAWVTVGSYAAAICGNGAMFFWVNARVRGASGPHDGEYAG